MEQEMLYSSNWVSTYSQNMDFSLHHSSDIKSEGKKCTAEEDFTLGRKDEVQSTQMYMDSKGIGI